MLDDTTLTNRDSAYHPVQQLSAGSQHVHRSLWFGVERPVKDSLTNSFNCKYFLLTQDNRSLCSRQAGIQGHS